MSFGTSQVPSYPQNSLRYGLLDIKPVEITENTKLGNIKFKVTRTKLEPTRPVETFEELVTHENTDIFASITIPDRFNIPKLIESFSKRSIDRFEKDSELQQEIENMKRLDRGKPFYNFISFMKERFEKERDDRLAVESQRFLMSNLPLSVFNKFVVYDNTYYDFLRTTQDIVRTYEFLANHSRNSLMYSKRISAMQHELGPLLDKFDNCSYAITRLKKYITVWNAESYDDLTWPKFFDVEKLNTLEFEQLSNDFSQRLREMRVALLECDPNILKKTINSNEPTTKMIGNLLIMPADSLGGGS
jgi:hypothetical protein